MGTFDFRVSKKSDTNWTMHKLHFHEAYEVMLVQSEGGHFFIDRDMYPLHQNTLIVLPSNCLHRDEHDTKDSAFRRYVFHILPHAVEDLSTQQTNFRKVLSDRTPVCIHLDKRTGAEIVRLLEDIQKLPQGGFGADIREQMRLHELLLMICEKIQSEKQESGANNPDYKRVEPIVDFLRKNFRESLSLDEVARQFMMNKHYLCHTFKKGTGFSIMEYVIQLRIIEAQRLLRRGSTVQEAGSGSGFQSYEYFIRSFNKYTGVSPRKYAQQYRTGTPIGFLLTHSAEQL